MSSIFQTLDSSWRDFWVTQQKQRETMRSLYNKCSEIMDSLYKRLEDQGGPYQLSDNTKRVALDQCKNKLRSLDQSIQEMEARHKDEYENLRRAQYTTPNLDMFERRIEICREMQQKEYEEIRSDLTDKGKTLETLYQEFENMESPSRSSIFENVEETTQPLYPSLYRVEEGSAGEKWYAKRASVKSDEDEGSSLQGASLKSEDDKGTSLLIAGLEKEENLFDQRASEKSDEYKGSSLLRAGLEKEEIFFDQRASEKSDEYKGSSLLRAGLEKEENLFDQSSSGKSDEDLALSLQRSALRKKEKENKALGKSIKELNWQIQRTSSSLKYKEKDNEELKQRIKQMEASYQKLNDDARTALKDKEKKIQSLKQRTKDLEEMVQNMRYALKEKDEELKSFKDRVADQVAPAIKTGKAISLNSPVTKSRIKEMYDDLRSDWPQIKDGLKPTTDAKNVKKFIQEKFEKAKADMEEKKKLTEELFKLNKSINVAPSNKDEQYRKLTIQNLQLNLYNQKHDSVPQNTHDPMELLLSECYWLGCLMALNNPPLQPDWEHHPQSLDKWDILPRTISITAEMNKSR